MRKKSAIKIFVCGGLVLIAFILFFSLRKTFQKEESLGVIEKNKISDWRTAKEEGIPMEYLNYPAEYAQVYEDNYYFLDYTGKNQYTIYKNRGEKVGTFFVEEDKELIGFVKSGESFFAKLVQETGNRVNLAKVNLQKNDLEPIYSMVYATFDELTEDYFFDDGIYSVKENVVNNRTIYEITCRNLDGVILNDYSITLSNEKQNAYHVVKMKKDEILFEEIEKERRIFYVNNFAKKENKKIASLTFPSDKGIVNNTGDYKFEQDVLLAKLPIEDKAGKESSFCLCKVKYNDKKTEILLSQIEDFCCQGKYIFYIDNKYMVHKFDVETNKDMIINNKLKAMSLECTRDGLWIKEYDEVCKDGGEVARNHRDTLICMKYRDFECERVFTKHGQNSLNTGVMQKIDFQVKKIKDRINFNKDYYDEDIPVFRHFENGIEQEFYTQYYLYYNEQGKLIYAEITHYRGASYSIYYHKDELLHVEVGPFYKGGLFINGDMADVETVIKKDSDYAFVLEDNSLCLEYAYSPK